MSTSNTKKKSSTTSNLFLDMLKVAPLVDLMDEDGNANIRDSTHVKNTSSTSHEIIFVGEIKTNDTLTKSSNTTKKDSLRKRKRGISSPLKRSKKIQSKAMTFESNNSETIVVEATSTTSETLCIVQTCHVSRMRQAQLSIPPPFGEYPLCGLRYYESIEGEEVASASNFFSVPIRIATYNVLSQSIMERTGFLYPHLNFGKAPLASWEKRAQLLADEFNRLQADVFCLQEVETRYMESFFVPFFESHNYGIVFYARGGNYPDGCAIFYSRRKFTLHKYFEMHYNLGVSPLNADNVGQVLALNIVGTRSVLFVSNTHLIYNCKRCESKLSQLALLMAKMHEMEQTLRSELCQTQYHFVGHFLCGDFNMEPFSPIYRFVIDGNLRVCDFGANTLATSLESLDISTVKKGHTPARINLALMRLSSSCTFHNAPKFLLQDTSSTKYLKHTFNFASTYEHNLADSSKEVSMHPYGEVANPDFIFYTVAQPKTNDAPVAESFIRLRRRLTLPSVVDLDNTCGPMPNDQAGSDHLPLCAEFELLCK